jgi:hypothetical protein
MLGQKGKLLIEPAWEIQTGISFAYKYWNLPVTNRAHV